VPIRVELTTLSEKTAEAVEVIGMRRSMVAGFFALLMLGLAAPAWAQAAQTTEAFVVLSGRADVPEASRSATWWSFMARRPWMAP
jgi:hypothetical protein